MHSVIPVALGHVIAHYYSFLVFEGQRVRQAQRPPGIGANWLGTSGLVSNPRLIDLTSGERPQVVAIVLGHLAICGWCSPTTGPSGCSPGPAGGTRQLPAARADGRPDHGWSAPAVRRLSASDRLSGGAVIEKRLQFEGRLLVAAVQDAEHAGRRPRRGRCAAGRRPSRSRPVSRRQAGGGVPEDPTPPACACRLAPGDHDGVEEPLPGVLRVVIAPGVAESMAGAEGRRRGPQDQPSSMSETWSRPPSIRFQQPGRRDRRAVVASSSTSACSNLFSGVDPCRVPGAGSATSRWASPARTCRHEGLGLLTPRGPLLARLPAGPIPAALAEVLELHAVRGGPPAHHLVQRQHG